MASYAVQPVQSLREVGLNRGISHMSVGRILHTSEFHPYKLKFRQTLYAEDPVRRMEFCRWVQDQQLLNPNLYATIMFSDESLFLLKREYSPLRIQILGIGKPSL